MPSLEDIKQALLKILAQIIALRNAPMPPLTPPVLDWSNRDAVRTSIRMIADQEGLTPEQKNTMSQVLHCESNYRTDIIHPNIVGGKTMSTDFGVCQWNDYYHGKEITPDEALHNPEKAVRLMCQYVKRGQIGQWVCYSKKLYLGYAA